MYVHWTIASEYRAWTLFYALPVLGGILEDKFFQHYSLFSEALWLLLQSKVTFEDVDKAEALLQQFCLGFSALYGDRHCTANVHTLLHLPDAVRNLGPLWAHSTFPFEGMNGWLSDLYHGTREPQKQIVKAVLERQKLIAVSEVTHSDDQDVKMFLDHMLCTGQRYSITSDLGQSHLVLGKISNLSSLLPDELALLLSNCAIQQSTAKVYHRVLISGILHTTTSYLRSKVKSDCVLCFRQNGERIFGNAKHYLSYCTTSCTDCMKPCMHSVIVMCYQILPLDFRTDGTIFRHVYRISSTRFVTVPSLHYYTYCCFSETRIFYTEEIENKCVYMEFTAPDIKYIAELPNSKEKNL